MNLGFLRKLSSRFSLVLACAIAIGSAPLASAQQVLLTADTAINSAASTMNYGKSQTLTVSSNASPLLQFDLANILPSGVTASEVTRARLIVFPDALTTSGSFNVYPVTSAWTEGAVTYSTKPTVSTSSAGSATVSIASVPVAVAVTNLVQSWITKPSSNYGIELKAIGSTSFVIDSKENTATSHPAILQIDLIGLAGAAGPQGATGAAGPAGPQGATGATGPAGTIALPYSGSAAVDGSSVFQVANTGIANLTGSPDGISAYGGISGTLQEFNYGGTGVVGNGGAGDAETAEAATGGGIGVAGYGGGVPNNASGGDGGVFFGGNAGGSEGYGGFGVYTQGGWPSGIGLEAYAGDGGDAATFEGPVNIYGALYKSSGAFKIDHPLDPENKYLIHSFVESPDMMNIYNGNVVTDGRGDAVVELPSWFEALNKDFRYQLTAVGSFARVTVASKISNGKFTIRTDQGNVEVSWQVTGVRQDAWANAHRLPTEVEKLGKEKGHYIHPELFGHAGEPDVQQALHPHRVRPSATSRQSR